MKKGLLLGIFIYFITTSVLAAFDPSSANKKLDKITLSISAQELTLKVLNQASEKINALKKEAEKCVQENAAQLEELDEQLPAIDPGQAETITKEQLHFIEKRSQIEGLISECKLFVLRSNESLQALTDRSKQIKRNIILTPKEPLWLSIPSLGELTEKWVDELDSKEFFNITSINTYSKNELISLLFLSVVVSIVAFFVRYNMLAILDRNKDKKSDARLLVSNFGKIFFKHAIGIFLLLFLFCYTSIHDLHYDLDYLLNDVFLGGTLYLLILVVIEYLIFPYKKGAALFRVPRKLARRIKTYSVIYFGVLLIGLIGHSLSMLVQDSTLWSLVVVFYYTVLATTFMLFMYYTLSILGYFQKYPGARGYLFFILSLVFLVLIYLRWYGFEGLSTYILKGVMLTYIGSICAYIVFKLFEWIIDCFSTNGTIPHFKLFKFFNFQKDEVLLEMIILKVVVFLIVWGGYIVLLNEFWSFSELWSIRVREVALYGFDIANVNVVPARIIGGLSFFSISILMIKILKNIFYSRDQASFNAAEEAYVIILGYLGFGIILIFSLLIGGVNLQGLAIIAGALSVGIGFGLQNIVNNFVSGLVLLLERPVKRGDRIIVGDKEGFVADVGIRATRINTLHQTDVIIPNAELVSNKVINYMYKNKKARVTVYTEVEHGCDPVLVKTLLFQAARGNERVLQSSGDEPIVFFTGYTTSAIKFELWCTIDNINYAYITKSDLYFAINDLFKAHHIKIAFQQIDLHIKKPGEPPLLSPESGEVPTG